jgi:hypothetical protein
MYWFIVSKQIRQNTIATTAIITTDNNTNKNYDALTIISASYSILCLYKRVYSYLAEGLAIHSINI